MAIYPLFVVRNQSGQYLGTFRAKDAKMAIAKLEASDRSTASTFRKSQPANKWVGLTAELKKED
jgi:hypothetical protein